MAPTAATEPKVTQPMLSFGPQLFSDAQQEKTVVLLAKLIVTNMLPLSIMEGDMFQELVRFLEPHCKVPCRKTITDRLET